MKSITLLLLAGLMMAACEQAEQNYWTEGEEVDAMVAIEEAHETGDFDTYRMHYADTAKIYHNSFEAITLDEMIKGEGEMKNMFSSWEVTGEDGDQAYYEVVVDDDGEMWGGMWGRWEGTLADGGEKIAVPVHISYRFDNGKIVEEWGYWNEGPFVEHMMTMEMKKMEQDTTEVDN